MRERREWITQIWGLEINCKRLLAITIIIIIKLNISHTRNHATSPKHFGSHDYNHLILSLVLQAIIDYFLQDINLPVGSG